MIGIETRQNFIDLLLAVGELERQTEIFRQVLCKQNEFEPYATFKRLDRSEKGYLSADDLQDFLASNSCPEDPEFCQNLLTHYDTDMDGKLAYTEFLRLLLPMDNPDLRTHVAQRPNYDINRLEYLTYDIEYALTRLVDKEINVFRELSNRKALLLERYDFNINDCQKVIDKGGSGTLNFENLEKFFNENGFIPYDEEIVCILRRLDKDDDGRVTMSELVEFFNMIPETPSGQNRMRSAPQQNKRSNSPSREKILKDSPDRRIANSVVAPNKLNESTRQREINVTRDSAVSPIRNSRVDIENSIKPPTQTTSTIYRSSAEKNASPSRTGYTRTPTKYSTGDSSSKDNAERTQGSYNRNSNSKNGGNDEPSMSRQRRTPGDNARGLNYELPKSSPSQNNFGTGSRISPGRNVSVNSARIAKGFKDFIILDRESEVVKQDLALRHDFSVLDAYRLVDLDGKGNITIDDFLDFLADLGIEQTRSNISLMFKRYDQNKDGKLNYNEFSDLISPRQADYKSLINNRTPVNNDYDPAITNMFSEETKRTLVKAIRTLVENENSAEEIRNRIEGLNINLNVGFKELDLDRDGLLSRLEIRRGLEDNDISVTEKDLTILFDRLDSDKDGLISFSEFVQEFTPKLIQNHLIF